MWRFFAWFVVWVVDDFVFFYGIIGNRDWSAGRNVSSKMADVGFYLLTVGRYSLRGSAAAVSPRTNRR